MVVALPILESSKASTMSLDWPEWEMPMARLFRFRWEAMIACMWLSQQAWAFNPSRRNLWAASVAMAAELPRPKTTMRSAFRMALAAVSRSCSFKTVSVLFKVKSISAIRLRKMVKQLSSANISRSTSEVSLISFRMPSFMA